MSKEKQIEEMAKHCFFFEGEGCCCTDIHISKMCEDVSKTCGLYQTLENLYIAGYRKQSEGEWKQTIEPLGAHDVDCVECSVCGDSWVLDEDFDYDVVKDFWNYCPTCGAKMKGGEDNA